MLKHSRVGKVSVLGRLGSKMKEVLCNPTPWTGEHYERKGCHPCKSKEGACKKVNVTYKWTCLTCLGDRGKRVLYIGESSRSLWDMTQEHLDDLRRRD